MNWELGDEERQPEAVAAFLADLAKCPPGLELLPFFMKSNNFSSYSYDSIAALLEWRPAERLEPLDMAFSPSFAHALPSLLSTLFIGPIDLAAFGDHSHWMTHLPKTLTTLAWVAEDSNKQIDAIPHLPRGLTNLELHKHSSNMFQLRRVFGDLSAITSEQWPPGLSTLRITSWLLDPSHLPLLPQTLHTLTVHVYIQDPSPEDPHLDLSTLPPKLKHLSLYTDLKLTPGSGSLPPLETLYQREAASAAVGRQKEMDPSFYASFSSLRYLDLQNDEMRALVVWKLPTCLTKFKVTYWRCNWFRYLPPTLTFLDISRLLGIHSSSLFREGQVFRICRLRLSISLSRRRVATSIPLPVLLLLNHSHTSHPYER